MDDIQIGDLWIYWMTDKHVWIVIAVDKQMIALRRIDNGKTYTYSGETLYTFYVYRLKDDFHTEGIFAMSDWDAQFTPVA